MLRYLPLVRARGGRLVVACPRRLRTLLNGHPDIDRLIVPGDPVPPFDVQAPMLSLPYLFGTTLSTIPSDIPYLVPEPERCEHWRRRLSLLSGFKVGIAWQGSPLYPRDRWRSFPLAHFEPLARIEGVRLLSLQRGHGIDQLRALNGRFPVIDLGEDEEGDESAILELSAIVKNLDLVIVPDTMLAHLAGALGVPCWVALSFVSDGRWLLDREDSPWYPTARLFRQASPGEWDTVFQRMAEALRQRVIDRASPSERV
jgi:hypothetical protein